MAKQNNMCQIARRQVALRLSPILFFVILLSSTAAEAYLDPSTGSMVISAIVGIVASVALAVKTYWYKLKALFRRNPQNGKQPPD